MIILVTVLTRRHNTSIFFGLFFPHSLVLRRAGFCSGLLAVIPAWTVVEDLSIHDSVSHSFCRLHIDVVCWINAEVRSGR